MSTCHMGGMSSALRTARRTDGLDSRELMPCVCPPPALNMTSASSFQMLRGAVIIFTGLFSVAFLGRRLVLSQWLGILATIAGLVVVGLADLLSKHDNQHKLSDVITGAKAGGGERGEDPGAALPPSLGAQPRAKLCCMPSPGWACGDQLLWTGTCSPVGK